MFAADIVASELDSRHDEGATLKAAEELMADAVGAEQAFFSTCGSSLSVKAAMLAVAGELELEPVMLPRDAFFGPVEQVPVWLG